MSISSLSFKIIFARIKSCHSRHHFEEDKKWREKTPLLRSLGPGTETVYLWSRVSFVVCPQEVVGRILFIDFSSPFHRVILTLSPDVGRHTNKRLFSWLQEQQFTQKHQVKVTLTWFKKRVDHKYLNEDYRSTCFLILTNNLIFPFRLRLLIL